MITDHRATTEPPLTESPSRAVREAVAGIADCVENSRAASRSFLAAFRAVFAAYKEAAGRAEEIERQSRAAIHRIKGMHCVEIETLAERHAAELEAVRAELRERESECRELRERNENGEVTLNAVRNEHKRLHAAYSETLSRMEQALSSSLGVGTRVDALIDHARLSPDGAPLPPVARVRQFCETAFRGAPLEANSQSN